MDIYHILKNFDAVNNNQTLSESQMKRYLEDLAIKLGRSEFVANAGEYGMSAEEAVEFWNNINGADDEELDEADMEEGNKFAYNVLKAKAAGMKKADLDADGDMETVREVFPGTPEYELRFGKDDASSAFDKKKVSTGTVYSRKHFAEPESGDDDTPRKAGRPTGTGRKLGAKGPSVASKLLKGKGGLKEHDHELHNGSDSGEYNDEAGMARQDLHTVVDAAKELHDILASDENLPEWVQAKLTKALDYIDTSRDYVKSSHAEQGDESIPEAGYSAKSARAGKDIGKPGKNFSKIAKGAAERYGSKAAGERVAGAVLNKLRHPKESAQPNEKQDKFDAAALAQHKRRLAQDANRRKMAPKPMEETGMGGTVAGGIAPAPGQKTFAEASSGSHEVTWKAAAKAVHAIMKKRGYAGSKTERGYMWTKQTPKGTAFVDVDFDERDPDTAHWGEGELKGAKNKSYYQSGNDSVSDLAQVINKLFANVKIGQPAMDEADEDGKKDKPDFGKKKSDNDEDESDNDADDKELKLMKSRAGVEDKDEEDDKAEKAGKKVTKDVEYDEKDDDESDEDKDDKAEKDGKKVTKDIEYDDKKDEEEDDSEDTKESKDESADKPKKSGGMKVGTGVYESAFNRSLKSQLQESINMNTSQDSDGKKSVTVTASDEDADKLSELLKMAGLFSSEGYSSVCQSCGGIHQADACGADHVEEDLANSPDELYTDSDYMTQTLSGGLNGPKTTGQTTVPVINRQNSRQGVMDQAERVTEQAKSRLWDMYKKYDKK